MTVATLSPRERLLEVASRLFYSEGIHAVGIDRVIAEAGVAKATLYAHFASKGELVAAYLSDQSRWWSAAVKARVGQSEPGSIGAALAPFTVLGERAASPSYRGCPFINAAAEFPGPGPVAEQVSAHRRRVRATFGELTGVTGEDDAVIEVIMALYDGAMSGAYLDHNPEVVGRVSREVEALLERRRQQRVARRQRRSGSAR